jgi:hypothetical protein
MCSNIKATGITIITIAFDLNDAWTEARLKNCGSTPVDFHTADSDDELDQVFEAVASKLEKSLRLSG